MGKDSKIEWTDHTFNPWWGCTKVSEGCKNCYAAVVAERFYKKHIWGTNKERRFFPEPHWHKPQKWNRLAEKKGIRARVFCGSMCDLFEIHEKLSIDNQLAFARGRVFGMISNTSWLDWLLLTKRPENVLDTHPMMHRLDTIFPNVWLGVSVENQEQADKRIPELLKIPAKIRFLSVEPMLERIDISAFIGRTTEVDSNRLRSNLSSNIESGERRQMASRLWVICGGESGRNKRPFNPDWARSIRDQCKEAGVPFFMKQWDKVQPIPDDLMIREFPNEHTK